MFLIIDEPFLLDDSIKDEGIPLIYENNFDELESFVCDALELNPKILFWEQFSVQPSSRSDATELIGAVFGI